MKIVIFLYEYSTLSVQDWLQGGYEVWCFDGQHPKGVTREQVGNGVLVKVGMWLERDIPTLDAIYSLVGDGVVFVGGFPECTHLAVSGAAHFKKKLEANPDCQRIATERAKLVEDVANMYDAPWFAENPVSVLATLWRKSNYSFHPYEYGGYLPEDDVHPTYPEYINPRDAYPKKTCFWTGNGFVMPDKKEVFVERDKQGKVVHSKQHSKLGGKSLKTKNIRSASPRGIMRAIYLANK